MGGNLNPPNDEDEDFLNSTKISDIVQLDGNISLNISLTSHQNNNKIPVIKSNRPTVFPTPKRKAFYKTIRRNNLVFQALNLSSVMNINPRSIYNKADEFSTLVEQYQSEVIFMSETWDRVTQPLEQIIKIENYKIITAANPRNFRGGKPALIINQDKYHIKPLNPDPITVPNGVEAVWALITPKDFKPSNQFSHIVVASIYYRGPKSTKKEELFDHISETYHVLMTKYGSGLHFIIAGDTNRLNLKPILSLSPSLKQLVQTPTRLNPDAILDPVITTMHKYYLPPVTKPPINNDEEKKGKPSDHLVVLMYPINSAIDYPRRQIRYVECRPLPQSGINKMGIWLQKQTWKEIYGSKNVNEKAETLQNMVLQKLDEYLPLKMNKFTSDDKPWVTNEVKQLDRLCKRELYKNQKSQKWHKLREKFLEKCALAKERYYSSMVEDLKESNPSQWYSKVKRMGGITGNQSGDILLEELSGVSNQCQADTIAQHYAGVSNEYKHLEKDDIPKNLYETNDKPPVIEAYQVFLKIQKMSTRKACVKGDIPMKIIKEFAVELAEPLAHILSFGIAEGQYPDLYKFETITPVPKIYPPERISQLRKISGLKNFAKIFDSFLAEFMTADMMPNQEQAQYGNQKGLSTQHYLVRMIHNILTATDRNTKDEAKTVIVQMIDWQSAFDRQCHRLGILSFLKNGVRKTLSLY